MNDSVVCSALANTLTKTLAAAWQSGQALTEDEAKRLAPASPEQAYRVQKQLGDLLNWWPEGRPRAWKLTTTRPALAAPVPDTMIHQQNNCQRCFQPHTVCGLEVELGCRLARPLYPDMKPKQVRDAIGQTLAMVEIFDVRADNWRQLPANFLLADLQMHGGLILGDAAEGWIRSAELELHCPILGSEYLRYSPPMEDLLYWLPWLAGHAQSQGWSLEAGDLIALGSWCGMVEVERASVLTGHFDGVGNITVNTQNLIKDGRQQ